jgi:RNA polymerase sigma factor (sigma-70 family)
MSAYRSFFIAARDGKFRLDHSDDLWRLLVEVTLHKLYHAAHRHLAERRSVNREQHPSGASTEFRGLASHEPTPDEALAAADELSALLEQLGDRDRQVLELRLQGHEHEEIANRLNCSERTVRRAISQARRLMATRGGPQFVATRARRLSPSRMASSDRDHSPPIDATEAPLNWSDFLLHEQIGAGSTGKVYRASLRKGGGDVAIKFLRKSLVGNASAMRRLLAEWRIVAQLRHPSIVAVHGAGRTPGGGLFLSMDLVRGKNLDQVQHQQPVSVTDAVRWVRVAAFAVAFAHEKGVIHCDLKPSNILIDHDGKIRISDFGLAVYLADVSGLRSLWAGTPAFMAPEQVDSCWGPISVRTDIWGLGSVLYFLLFGQPPHIAPDVPGTLAAVVSKTPIQFPDNATQPLPKPLVDILKRCLAKAPNDRLSTAQDLASKFADCLQSK